MSDDRATDWLAGHVYHHEHLDAVVRSFVHPLVVDLVARGWIDAFFFLRYGLGGPHVRLRLRAVPGARDDAAAAMEAAAHRFLAETPSTRSLDPETIIRTNEMILANDPHEDDATAYPDNTFRAASFHPEVARYGGRARLHASLHLFTLSSVAALAFGAAHRDAPRATQLAHAFRLLFDQALAFAVDATELADLLRYGVDAWGKSMPTIVEKGDRVARGQATTFHQLVEQSVTTVAPLRTAALEPSTGGPTVLLIRGKHHLARFLHDADRPTRARIAGSQLHMTASRLGLTNPEEVYLCRLLTVTLADLQAQNALDLAWLSGNLASGRNDDPGRDLADLCPLALAVLPPATVG